MVIICIAVVVNASYGGATYRIALYPPREKWVKRQLIRQKDRLENHLRLVQCPAMSYQRNLKAVFVKV